MSRPKVTAADVIGWIEAHCRIPEGRLIGRKLELAPFQREIITLIYDNPHGTRRAYLSMGRKSAKTTLAGCLLLNHLCGPSADARPNSQLYSCAQSRDQAAIIFALARKMVRLDPRLTAAVKIQETAKALSCPELGTYYRALSAEATTAHGLSPQFVVHDELGRVRGPRSPLYEAMETATGGIEGALSVAISTQAASDDDLFSILLDDALAGADPRTVARLFSAPVDMDPFSEAAIRAANPGFDHFMNRAEVLDMAEIARRMPAREAEFRNLILNQRIDPSEGAQFVNRDVWLSNDKPPRDLRYLQVYGGLDLSSVGDLTVFVLAGYDPFEGDWSVKVYAWLPSRGLDERAAADRELYRRWVDEGLLRLVPGGSIKLALVARQVAEIIAEYPNFQRVAYDRWGTEEFLRGLEDVMSADEITRRFVPHGQGYKDMAPSISSLERVLLDGNLRHGGNLILNSHFANAVTLSDDAGNRKFTKKRSHGRIDAIVALAMAIGISGQKGPRTFDVRALIG
jgi:phage terminase large subunit-like protein